jgi:cytochrome P450
VEAAEPLVESPSRRPPGPNLPWWRQLAHVRRDFFGYLEHGAVQYGDVFVIKPAPSNRIVVLNSAALALEVTVTRAHEFQKSAQTRFMVGKFLGNGLVLSEGETHQKQRRLLQPSFGPKGLGLVARAAVARTQALLADAGEVVDVEPAMTRLSMDVILEFLLGAPAEDTGAGEAFRVLADAIGGRFKSMPLPAWVPTSRNRLERAAVRNVTRLVESLLAQSRANGHDHTSVLATLGKALDGKELPFEEVRDQAITLLFAGHETVAKALAWTLLLLARHPDVQAKARAEVRAHLIDGNLASSALPRLKYLSAVIKEALRLDPPVWVFDRSPVASTTVGGYDVGPKDVLYVSPYLLHRDARYFAEPLRFDPARFAGASRFLDGAYMPFGAGPRGCIGQSLAFLETTLVVATILATHEVVDRTPGEVKPRPDATFAPASQILLTFQRS